MRRIIKKKPTSAPMSVERDYAPPLFKNSLLAWQARWKAQGGTGSASPRPSVPSRPA